jgi:two-component system chemotaxis response regulator CheB
MNKNVIVIGASAGGVAVLQRLVAGLPADLNAAVFIVLHLGASTRSTLHEILQRETPLVVRQARDGEAICMGQIRTARPDYHLVLEANAVRLVRGPHENRFRPAVDALFRSAAYTHGTRVIGTVLTGALDDGASGLWWIKNRGGTTVVQDPEDAEFPSMPSNTLSQVRSDFVVRAADVAGVLSSLTQERAAPMNGTKPRQLEVEVQIAKEGNALQAGVMELGQLTPYTCPECHGALVQLKEGPGPYFRCHTGHAYSISTLLSEVTEYVEESLWSSIRAIEESAMLLSHMARHSRESTEDEDFAHLCEEKAQDTLRRAKALREVANEQQTLSRENMADVDPGAR